MKNITSYKKDCIKNYALAVIFSKDTLKTTIGICINEKTCLIFDKEPHPIQKFRNTIFDLKPTLKTISSKNEVSIFSDVKLTIHQIDNINEISSFRVGTYTKFIPGGVYLGFRIEEFPDIIKVSSDYKLYIYIYGLGNWSKINDNDLAYFLVTRIFLKIGHTI